MAYDSSEYDVTPLIRNQSPLEDAGIDFVRALKDPDGVDRELANRSQGIVPASVAQNGGSSQIHDRFANIPDANGNGALSQPGATVQAQPAAQTENTVSGDFNSLRSRMRTSLDKSAQLRQDKESLSTPTDPNQAQYKPTVGRRILRGLAGAGLGFAQGGLTGAAVGAVAPQLTTGVGYKDPNSKYRVAEAARTGKLAATDQQLADTEAQAKDEFSTGDKLLTAGSTLAERQNTTQRNTDQAKHESSEDTAKMNDLHQQLGKATAAAMTAGRDPRQDPDVQKISDTIQGAQKEPAEKNPTDLSMITKEAERRFPNDPAKQYQFKTAELARIAGAKKEAGREDKPPKRAISANLAAGIEARKNKKIETAKKFLQDGYDQAGNPFTQDEYNAALDEAQTAYEGEIGSARGEPLDTHVDLAAAMGGKGGGTPAVPASVSPGKPAAPAAKPAASSATKATPQTHGFSVSKWKAANPNGDVEKIKAAAKKAGYKIID